jgi:transcriptional regulator with XRE-family HTH domain
MMAMSTSENSTTWKIMAWLAENLKAIRTRKGLSQQDVADAVGVSFPRISEIENGKGNPRIQTLERIASSLGVKVNDLISDPKKSRKSG